MQGRRKGLGALAGSAIALAAVAGPALTVMAGPDSMIMFGAASHPSAAGQPRPDGVLTIGGRTALGGEWLHDDGAAPGANHQPACRRLSVSACQSLCWTRRSR
jgi:hypothetical protein